MCDLLTYLNTRFCVFLAKNVKNSSTFRQNQRTSCQKPSTFDVVFLQHVNFVPFFLHTPPRPTPAQYQPNTNQTPGNNRSKGLKNDRFFAFLTFLSILSNRYKSTYFYTFSPTQIKDLHQFPTVASVFQLTLLLKRLWSKFALPAS